MKQKYREHVSSNGPRVLDIPLTQLHRDPNQPRTRFDPEKLEELAASIKSRGLQQLPGVNFAFMRDGKPHYYLKAGERRQLAHAILKRETMRCIVEVGIYDGTFDINRKLSQAAENSAREPHTHAEIVAVMEEVIRDELASRGEKTFGAIEAALARVAQAFGKSRAWAENYYKLTRLHPELREMLDSKNDDERLNFNVAIALSRIPLEQQHELLAEAKKLKEKGGHVLMYRFILREARSIQEDHGVKIRGKRPSDDKTIFVRMVETLHRQSASFCGERRSSEYKAFIQTVLHSMETMEVDALLHKMNEAMLTFKDLQAKIQERRDFLYKSHGLHVVGGQ